MKKYCPNLSPRERESTAMRNGSKILRQISPTFPRIPEDDTVRNGAAFFACGVLHSDAKCCNLGLRYAALTEGGTGCDVTLAAASNARRRQGCPSPAAPSERFLV